MSSTKEPSGDINVSMGDGNTVGHIGHVFNATPAPPPNGVMQNARQLGLAEGLIEETETSIICHALHTTPDFDRTKPFHLAGHPGVGLLVQGFGGEGRVAFAGIDRRTMYNVMILKTRRT